MNKQEKRLNDILYILRSENAASTRELSQKLNVTEMTIRRDLGLLAESSRVRIIHGGAIFTGNDHREDIDSYRFSYEETRNKTEKTRIGRMAASLVEPGETIILDGGSTVEYVARSLPQDSELIVLCYSLNLINLLCRNPKWKKVMSGGYFNDDSLMFESPRGAELIRSMRASKAFIGATGAEINLGLTCKNTAEVESKRAAISSASSRILVIDSTKFGQVHIAHFADFDDFDMVITDTGIPDEYARAIRVRGVRLHVA